MAHTAWPISMQSFTWFGYVAILFSVQLHIWFLNTCLALRGCIFDWRYLLLTSIRYVALCEPVLHLPCGAASQCRYDEMSCLPSCIHRPLICFGTQLSDGSGWCQYSHDCARQERWLIVSPPCTSISSCISPNKWCHSVKPHTRLLVFWTSEPWMSSLSFSMSITVL